MTASQKFSIAPHFRLHEWVAEQEGYFSSEGLDYEFSILPGITHGKPGQAFGAYQTFEQGRPSDVSCACHWTVNMAAADGHGRLYRDAYSVAPCAIFVDPDSGIEKPEDLAGVPIAVGYQSGSHYSTIQALEQWLAPDEINLDFGKGLLFSRLEMLVDGEAVAASLFSAPYYAAEQLGFHKVTESSFMMASMIDGEPGADDVSKYFRALRRAQAAIDLRPEQHTSHYMKELPERFHDTVDVRRFGPGERIVFEPYTEEMFETSQRWIAEHGIFPDADFGSYDYEQATISIGG